MATWWAACFNRGRGSRAALWDQRGALTVLDDRTGYPEFALEARDINERGDIVGLLSLDTHDPTFAVFWSRDGVIQVPLTQEGAVAAINARGTSVGRDGHRAVVWTQDAVLIVLEAAELSAATDINDRGDVVGYVERRDGETSYMEAMIWHLNGADRHLR